MKLFNKIYLDRVDWITQAIFIACLISYFYLLSTFKDQINSRTLSFSALYNWFVAMVVAGIAYCLIELTISIGRREKQKVKKILIYLFIFLLTLYAYLKSFVSFFAAGWFSFNDYYSLKKASVKFLSFELITTKGQFNLFHYPVLFITFFKSSHLIV